MNRETINNNENKHELIDISDEGVIRATGEGVVPIIDILNNTKRLNSNKYDIINQGNNDDRQIHLRNSPFGTMVNPLFETGERIHMLSRNVNDKKEEFKPIPESVINSLETINDFENIHEDCSICLEELNKKDIPEYKYILASKSKE